MTITAAAFALSIGVVLGLLGAGGSAIAVPVFVYALGLPIKEAIASSLPVVGAVTLVGAVRHAARGDVDFRAAALFAPTAIAGAYGGARLASLISGEVQLTIFAMVMLTAAALMYRESPRDPAGADEEAVTREPIPVIPMALAGSAVGTMTGLVGVGGGFLIVPALALFAKLPMRAAVGTSLAVISANSVSGFLGYVGLVPVNWGLIGGFTLVAASGVLVGSSLCGLVSHRNLKRGFAFLLALVAGLILIQRALESRTDGSFITQSGGKV